jgi:uncharacterized protein (DUF433 family)
MEPTAARPPDSQAEPSTVPVITEYVGVRPGYCGGKPHILGHRIKVKHVAIWHEQQGMTPTEIVATYPTITLAQVHAALAYYYDHRDEIQAEIEEERRFVEDLRAGQPSIFDKVWQRNALVDSISPGRTQRPDCRTRPMEERSHLLEPVCDPPGRRGNRGLRPEGPL